MSLTLRGVHHVAIIAVDYVRSKDFYCRILGLRVIAEVYRDARDSWKLDLALPDGTQIELFSFPAPPPRPSRPEACGLRHLALRVDDLDAAVAHLQAAFADNWMKTRADVLNSEMYFPVLDSVGTSLAQVFKSSPREGADSARLMFL
jgi:glyoxylase I family protein